MKKFLTFFLTALLTFSVGWAATETDVLDMAFTGVTGTSYSSWSGEGTSGAVYAGNSAGGNSSIQLRSTKASAIVTTASGGKVKSVTVVWNSNTQNGRTLQIYCSHSAYTLASFANGNKGTLIGTIVKGTSTSLTISGDYEYIALCSASGAMYLTSISIDWEQGGTSTVTPPTITPDGGDILASQEISLSAEDGASIYYTINGDNPTTSSTLYTDPFTLNSSATVKAIAVKDGVSSTVTSATFNVVAGVPTIAAALAYGSGQFIFAGEAVVTYQNGRNVWIRDNSGSGLIYRNSGETSAFNNGDILTPGWKASNTTHQQTPEFGSPSGVTFLRNDGTVAPELLPALTVGDVNKYVSMSNVTVTSVDGDNYYVNNATGYCLRKQFTNSPTLSLNKTYNVVGVVWNYNGLPELYLISAEEVVTGDPTITLDPTSLTIDDSGTNNSFTVTARNLHENDNGNVSVAHNWVFNTTLTSGTNSIANWNGLQGFNRNYRSVDGTVTVNYEGRALTATDTYTVATEGASQTLTVTYVPSLYIVGNFGNAGWNYSAEAATPMTNDGNGIYTATLDIPANSYILFSRKSGETYNWDTNRYFIGAVMDNGQDWVYGVNALPGLLDTDPSNPSKYRPIKFPEGGTYTITIDANNYTFNITKKIVGADDFVLVTNTDEVDTAGEYVLVYSSSSTDRAMGQTYNSSGNYYSAVTEGFELDNNIVTLENSNDVNILTLEDAGDGLFYIVDQTGKYIYLNSNSNVVHQASSINQSEVGKYKWSIIINNKGEVEILNTNFTDNRYLQCNYSANPSRYACYKNTMGNAKLYKRGGSASISVPSTLDLIIPAGATSVDGSVTVTEKNVTGTTTISSVDGDASNFNVTLTGTTLSVTYSGTATQDNPEVITINLVNGEATASITVTGYKVPLTVTIMPVDGATFSHDSMDGTITANAEDAVIYYKTNEMDDFEVYNGSFTVTNNMTEDPWVQAYAVCGSETSATVTATYHHVSLSETLFTRVTSTDQLVADNKYILVFDRAESPLALSGNGQAAVVAWSDDNINIAGTSATVFTLGETSDGYTLYCNDGYLTHNGRSTTYSETANSLSIDADGESGYYIMEGSYYLLKNSQANETGDPFRWYTGTSSGSLAYLFVQGVEEQPTIVSLATIESNNNLLNKKVTVDGQLIGVWAVNNGATKLLWAKDQDQASIDKRPARTEAQDDYMVNRMKYQHYEFEGEYDWDESNWVILDFANLDGENPDNYVGHKLANKSVTGTYDDANEYTLTLTKAPSRVNEDEQDAPEYPGYNGDNKGQHDASNYGKDYRWAYNSYMPANFMPDNLNRIDADTVAGAHSGEHALPNMQNQQLYFMNPKIMEVAHLWGVWCGSGSDKFSIYTVGMENNETVNAWDLHGAVDVISWKYNNKGGGEYSQPYLEDATAQDFHAVIVRKNRGNSLMAGVNNDPSSSEYGIYPLDLPEGGHPTAVREVNTGKQVLSVRYYNIMGVEASQPFDGVNIIVTRYTDGSSSAIKVIK